MRNNMNQSHNFLRWDLEKLSVFPVLKRLPNQLSKNELKSDRLAPKKKCSRILQGYKKERKIALSHVQLFQPHGL